MAWCTTSELADAIFKSRVSPETSPSDRRTHENRLLSMYDECINVGDCLIEIALSNEMPEALRLNASFAAEPLFRAKQWLECDKFSDKSLVQDALVAWFYQLPQGPLSCLSRSILKCVARLLLLEFFSASALPELYAQAVQNFSTVLQCRLVLELAAEDACHTPRIWFILSDSLAQELLTVIDKEGFTPASIEVVLSALRILTLLLSRRPRPSAAAAAGLDLKECFLMSHLCAERCLGYLRHIISLLCSSVAADDMTSLVHLTDALLILCQRFTRHYTIMRGMFECATVVLGFYAGNSYASLCHLGVDYRNLLDSALESLVYIMAVPPDALPCVSTTDFMTAIVPFTALPDECGDITETQTVLDDEFVEEHIKALVLQDEVVPLGCGGGTTGETAAAVVEGFVERQTTAVEAVMWSVQYILSSADGVLKNNNNSVSVGDEATITLRVVAPLLTLLNRCCAEMHDGAALVDLITDVALRDQLFSVLCALLRRAELEDVIVFVTLLDAVIAAYFTRDNTYSAPLLRLITESACVTALSERGASPATLQLIEAFMCRCAASLLLRVCSSSGAAAMPTAVTDQAPGDVLARLVRGGTQTAALPTFTRRYCAGEALLALLRCTDGRASSVVHCYPAECCAVFHLAFASVPIESRALVELLTNTLRHLSRVSSTTHSCAVTSECYGAVATTHHNASVGGGSRRNVVQRYLGCRGLAALCASSPLPSTNTSPVTDLPCTVCTTTQDAALLALLEESCSDCARVLSVVDDSGARTFADALGVIIARNHPFFSQEGESNHPILAARTILCHLLQCACLRSFSSQTISHICCSLAALEVSAPGSTADAAASIFTLVAEHVTTGRKAFAWERGGYGLHGVCLLLSLLIIRNPHVLSSLPHEGAEFSSVLRSLWPWYINLTFFGDDVCTEYLLMAVDCCLHALSQSPPDVQRAWRSEPVLGAKLCRFPNLIANEFPENTLTSASILQGLFFALLGVSQRSQTRRHVVPGGASAVLCGASRQYMSATTGRATPAVLDVSTLMAALSQTGTDTSLIANFLASITVG